MKNTFLKEGDIHGHKLVNRLIHSYHCGFNSVSDIENINKINQNSYRLRTYRVNSYLPNPLFWIVAYGYEPLLSSFFSISLRSPFVMQRLGQTEPQH